MASSTALTADQILERRKMKRRITLWRLLTLIALAMAIIATLWALGAFDNLGKRNNEHIARVDIGGVITNDRDLLELLDSLAEKNQVKAVILNVSSPGGSTVGGEAIYEAVRTLADKKPVVASVGSLAASAGYMIASASDRIFSRRSSIVGSIGVYFQYASARQLLEKVGVEMGMVKSSPLKGEPAPFNEVTEAEKQMLRRLVDDSYKWFVGLVAERRNMSLAQVRKLADGSIYSGAQAVENGLIDEIGDEEAARKWLVAQKGISDELEIEEWKPERETPSLFSSKTGKLTAAIVWVSRQLGFELPVQATNGLEEILPKRLLLDGLVSMLTITSDAHFELD